MTKECECAAHSAVECCCGAWDEPQRKPLTLHELSKIFASIPSIPFDGDWQLELVRAVETAHGIKE